MSPESIFYTHPDHFLVAVDCIILGFKDNELQVLVHNRALEPDMGKPSLMGGFVNKNESVNDAAIRVLTYLTGLENIFMEQVAVYGDMYRDPGERVISCVYYALIDASEQAEDLLLKHKAYWINITRSNELIFDHPQMLGDAINILRRKAAIQPIGFNLLPEKFTLTQLQALYEAIYGKELDRRNFRKKMMNFNFLEKLNEVDKSGSKKGAYYYKFKQDRIHLLNGDYGF